MDDYNMMQQDDDNIFFEEVGRIEPADQNVSRPKMPIQGSYANLYDELIDKCNPEEFMVPYDKEKIDVANEIYSQLMDGPKDQAFLKGLRSRAINELGVSFCTSEIYDRLVEVCHPRNFSGKEHYDPKRLKIANNIYHEIIENADNIEVLESCEVKAHELILIIEERNKQISLEEEKKKKQNDIINEINHLKTEIDTVDGNRAIIAFTFFAFDLIAIPFVSVDHLLLSLILFVMTAPLFVYYIVINTKDLNELKKKYKSLTNQQEAV